MNPFDDGPGFSLETAVRHPARLAILGCLEPDAPMAGDAVKLITGVDVPRGSYRMRVLLEFGLVEARQMGDGGPLRYVPRLDQHPIWVTEAVESQRPG